VTVKAQQLLFIFKLYKHSKDSFSGNAGFNYTISGSFLLSIEKPRVENTNTPIETKTTTTIPTAMYGIILNVLDIAAGFIIPPRTMAKIMMPIDMINENL
jgi:hypothetical protein